jgi:Na+-transporting NADH:ubiquinone oxidoreductase subunit A
VCFGNYPADDPGVLLYYIKTRPDENRAWYIGGQDLILLGELFKTGKFPLDRTIAVGGSRAVETKHVLIRAGAPLARIAGDTTGEATPSRYIVGGIFRGYTVEKDSYMGFSETSLVLLNKGDREEFLGFARPGFNKPSRSRAFLSVFNQRPYPFDCGSHGEERACVNCGYCSSVCPVDILPQFTFKCIVADEIEEALAHGMLDCVECGLCTYVCPSKIELGRVLKQTKTAYYLEQA